MDKNTRYGQAVLNIFEEHVGRINDPEMVKEVYDSLLTPSENKQFGFHDVEGNTRHVDSENQSLNDGGNRYAKILQEVADVINDLPLNPTEFDIEDMVSELSDIGADNLTLEEKADAGWDVDDMLELPQEFVEVAENNGFEFYFECVNGDMIEATLKDEYSDIEISVSCENNSMEEVASAIDRAVDRFDFDDWAVEQICSGMTLDDIQDVVDEANNAQECANSIRCEVNERLAEEIQSELFDIGEHATERNNAEKTQPEKASKVKSEPEL